MTSAGRPQATPWQEQEYLRRVRDEIRQLDRLSRRQLWRHRSARIVVITAGASVPVLAAWAAVPRPVLGAVGAIAAIAEGIAQLFQWQSTATNMVRTANALERALNRFLLVDSDIARAKFVSFAKQVEDVREVADRRTYESLNKTTTPPIGPTDTPAPG